MMDGWIRGILFPYGLVTHNIVSMAQIFIQTLIFFLPPLPSYLFSADATHKAHGMPSTMLDKGTVDVKAAKSSLHRLR